MTKKFVTRFKIVWLTLLWGGLIAAAILKPLSGTLILTTIGVILNTIQVIRLY